MSTFPVNARQFPLKFHVKVNLSVVTLLRDKKNVFDLNPQSQTGFRSTNIKFLAPHTNALRDVALLEL